MQSKKPVAFITLSSTVVIQTVGNLYSWGISKYADKAAESASLNMGLIEQITPYASFFGLGMVIAIYWERIGYWLKSLFYPKLFKREYLCMPTHIVGNFEHAFISIKIRFLRTIKNASIQILVDGCIKNGVPKQHFAETIITNKDYLLDSEEYIRIATIPNTPSLTPFWGLGNNHLIKLSKNIATIRVSAGRYRQDYKVFIDFQDNKYGVYFFSEDDDLWEGI